MRFLQWDLGYLQGGEVVEVTLKGQAQNVELLDSSNFSAFKGGRNHRYYGGLVSRSPHRVRVPRAGHWYVVVHLGGYPGRLNAGVRVLPGALPPARQTVESPLASIRQAAEDYQAGMGDLDEVVEDKEFDVFISHASEDKDAVVRPLAQALSARNVSVWYDEVVLKIGDSLRRTIDRGLMRSRFGVVVLSPAFFGRGWPNYELDGLATREVSGGRQIILPIWHNVSRDDVMRYSPSLAGKLARSTGDRSIDEIAEEIAAVVAPLDLVTSED
ncbi:MAG: DUF1883 domain-containing protein [Chloroflexota bacterium]|nr:DUF1883 domain-containing protein [Chloroflexota bacterium]